MPVMSVGSLSVLGRIGLNQARLTGDDIILRAQRCDDRGLTNGEDASPGAPILDVQFPPLQVSR